MLVFFFSFGVLLALVMGVVMGFKIITTRKEKNTAKKA